MILPLWGILIALTGWTRIWAEGGTWVWFPETGGGVGVRLETWGIQRVSRNAWILGDLAIRHTHLAPVGFQEMRGGVEGRIRRRGITLRTGGRFRIPSSPSPAGSVWGSVRWKGWEGYGRLTVWGSGLRERILSLRVPWTQRGYTRVDVRWRTLAWYADSASGGDFLPLRIPVRVPVGLAPPWARRDPDTSPPSPTPEVRVEVGWQLQKSRGPWQRIWVHLRGWAGFGNPWSYPPSPLYTTRTYLWGSEFSHHGLTGTLGWSGDFPHRTRALIEFQGRVGVYPTSGRRDLWGEGRMQVEKALIGLWTLIGEVRWGGGRLGGTPHQGWMVRMGSRVFF